MIEGVGNEPVSTSRRREAQRGPKAVLREWEWADHNRILPPGHRLSQARLAHGSHS
jgi:hypothetical protein